MSVDDEAYAGLRIGEPPPKKPKPRYENANEIVEALVNIDHIVELLRVDYVSFILLFLHAEEDIELGVPDFHQVVFDYMVNEKETRTCIAIPRDHAKTTLAKLAAVYLFIYTRTRFLVYTSATHTIAANAVRDIVNFIRDPMCTQIFGEPVFTQEEAAKGNYTFQWRGKTIIIRSLGAAQQVRGMNVDNKRPDLAIVDDLESREMLDQKTGVSYEKLKGWFYSTFMKSLDTRRNKIIQIGNLVNKKSLLWDHLHSPRWRTLWLGAFTKDGSTLWPARWSVAKLRDELMEYIQQGKLYEWMAEMLNLIPSRAGNALSLGGIKTTSWVGPESEQILLSCITVDPAITENLTHANKGVIVAHVFVDDHWQIAEVDAQYGRDPYALYRDAVSMAKKWRTRVIGVETDGFQAAMLHIAEHENARLGIKEITWVSVHSNRKSKTSRIAAWIGMLKEGGYKLTEQDMAVFQEINDYDPNVENNDDDVIDCCAYILQMIARYSGQMNRIFTPDDRIPGTTLNHAYSRA